MNVWGADKVEDLNGFREGEILKVSVNIESREFNQRWYTDVRAWRIERNSEGTPSQARTSSSNNNGSTNSDPFSSDNDGGEDDLPF
jgi:hypothetical protein